MVDIPKDHVIISDKWVLFRGYNNIKHLGKPVKNYPGWGYSTMVWRNNAMTTEGWTGDVYKKPEEKKEDVVKKKTKKKTDEEEEIVESDGK